MLSALFCLAALAGPPEPLSMDEVAPPATTQEWRRLKPTRGRLRQHAHGATDYTAYTLEHGEIEIGLAAIRMGVMPRFHIGTVPLLDAAGVYNGHAKLDMARAGPVDIAALGSFYTVSLDGFGATYFDAGAALSFRVAKPWSVHATARYHRLTAEGIPRSLPNLPFVPQLPEQAQLDGSHDVHPWGRGEVLSVDLATDLRFTRRDAIVVRLQWVAWAKGTLDIGVKLPDEVPFEPWAIASTKPDLDETYVASVAYQASFRHLQVRIGVGTSAVPYAWLVPAFDLSWRMWGKTRVDEARERKKWRKLRPAGTSLDGSREPT